MKIHNTGEYRMDRNTALDELEAISKAHFSGRMNPGTITVMLYSASALIIISGLIGLWLLAFKSLYLWAFIDFLVLISGAGLLEAAFNYESQSGCSSWVNHFSYKLKRYSPVNSERHAQLVKNISEVGLHETMIRNWIQFERHDIEHMNDEERPIAASEEGCGCCAHNGAHARRAAW